MEDAKRIKPGDKCVISAGHGGKGAFVRIRDYAGQVYGREENHTLGGSGGNNCITKDKEAFLVLMLCAPVFIFTFGSSALLGRPRCGLSI